MLKPFGKESMFMTSNNILFVEDCDSDKNAEPLWDKIKFKRALTLIRNVVPLREILFSFMTEICQ